MIEITNISKPDNSMAFDCIVEFQVWDETWGDGALLEITDICKWCGTTFIDNYVLLEYSSLLISGGSTDNEKNWNVRLYSEQSPATTGEYHLRCSSQDCTMFVLKYKAVKQ